MAQEDVASIRRECWAQATHTFGTSWLFEQRAKKLRRRLQILTFLGIAVPVTVGASVLSFGSGNTFILQILIPFASFLGVLQVIISVWALSAKWDDGHAYAMESASENNRWYSRYRDLANTPPSDLADLERRFELLQRDNENRKALDFKQAVSEDEKRAGHRAGLRAAGRKCAACDTMHCGW